MNRRHIATGALLALIPAGVLVALLAAPKTQAGGTGTDVHEIVMYAINNDNPVRLLRYTFESQEYVVVGNLEGTSGEKFSDIECMSYIPRGEHQGFYCATNFNGKNRSKLIKVNPFTGKGTGCPADIGYGYVVGMISREKSPGQWAIYATHGGKVGGSGPVVKDLLEIDPKTGLGTVIMPLNNVYEGLARDATGTLYAVTAKPDKGLWTIILPKPGVAGSEQRIGTVGYDKVEALEFAFGDAKPQIDLPGVPASWTTNGILFGYSDTADKFLVINPQTGAAKEYATPFQAGFATSDAEGFVFFTKRSDPYGSIVASPYD